MNRLALILGITLFALVNTASARTWYITPDGTGDAPTIRAGCDSAFAGDTVLVACGTYYEHGVSMRSGVVLRSETGDPSCVTIDAGHLGPVLFLMFVDSSTYIEGLTLTGGHADTGGGTECYKSSPAITNCVFSRNTAVSRGAGLCCTEYSHPVISGCVFSENSAGSGNIYGQGGGMSVWENSSPDIIDCLFYRNEAMGTGGAMVLAYNSAPSITNCVFIGNSAETGSGLACHISSSPTVVNCTFLENSTNEDPAGTMYCGPSTLPALENTIIAFSTTGSALDTLSGGGVPTFACCDIYGNAGGDWVGDIAGQYGTNGNFSACPSFCFAGAGDVHLCDESPCLPGNHPDGHECGLIGALDVDCSCGPTATEATTWGAIKSTYR